MVKHIIEEMESGSVSSFEFPVNLACIYSQKRMSE